MPSLPVLARVPGLGSGSDLGLENWTQWVYMDLEPGSRIGLKTVFTWDPGRGLEPDPMGLKECFFYKVRFLELGRGKDSRFRSC